MPDRILVLNAVEPGAHLFKPKDASNIGPNRPLAEASFQEDPSALSCVECPVLFRDRSIISINDGEILPSHENCAIALLAEKMGITRMLCHRPRSAKANPLFAAQSMRATFNKGSPVGERVLNRIFQPGGFRIINAPAGGAASTTDFAYGLGGLRDLSCGRDSQIMNDGEPVMSLQNGIPRCGYDCALRDKLIVAGVRNMVCARTRPGTTDSQMVKDVEKEGYFDI